MGVPVLSTEYGKESGILVSYMDYLEEEGRIKPNTIYNYYVSLRMLAKFLKHRRNHMDCEPDEVVMHNVSLEEMASMTLDEWWDYLDYCQLKCHERDSSLAVRITIVRGFYQWLKTQTDTLSKDLDSILNTKRPIAHRKTFRCISTHAEDTLCEKLEGQNAVRNACIIRLFSRCGVGLQEICALDLEDVGMTSISVKGATGVRKIPLDEPTVNAINEYLKERIPPTDGSNAFFVSARKGRMKRGAIQKMLRRVTSRSGSDTLSKITVRGLQISAKAKMLEDGTANAPVANISSPYYVKYAYTHTNTKHG